MVKNITKDGKPFDPKGYTVPESKTVFYAVVREGGKKNERANKSYNRK